MDELEEHAARRVEARKKKAEEKAKRAEEIKNAVRTHKYFLVVPH